MIQQIPIKAVDFAFVFPAFRKLERADLVHVYHQAVILETEDCYRYHTITRFMIPFNEIIHFQHLV